MKITKLLAVALTATLMCGTVNVNAYAAEQNTAIVTEVESTQQSANEDTAIENISIEESNKKETSKKTTTKTAKTETVTLKSTKASYTKEQLRLLSSLIFCEAGSESYAGKVAVGIVVMNRVESKSFPSTLNNVIYQKYQFGPTRNGSLKKALANYDAGRFTTKNHKECIEAAKAALSGAKSVTYKGRTIDMKRTLYFSGRVSGAKFSIGNHQFK